jgi:hypothetical protein
VAGGQAAVAGGTTSVPGGPAPGSGRLRLASVPVPTRLGWGRASATGGGRLGDGLLDRAGGRVTTGGRLQSGVWRRVAAAWWVSNSSPKQRRERVGGEKGAVGTKFESSSGPSIRLSCSSSAASCAKRSCRPRPGHCMEMAGQGGAVGCSP